MGGSGRPPCPSRAPMTSVGVDGAESHVRMGSFLPERMPGRRGAGWGGEEAEVLRASVVAASALLSLEMLGNQREGG